ncbi:MAG: hypothetical protein AB8I08_28505 [Sandaracinaceae bacterium]
MNVRLTFFFALLLLLLPACDPVVDDADTGTPTTDGGPGETACAEPEAGPARAVFRLDADESAFFDLPWPTDLRRTSDGTIDVLDFPNPGGNVFVEAYLEALTSRLEGFGTNGAVYFRFSQSVDPASLPDTPEASLEDGTSVALIDLETGALHPIVVSYQDCPRRYWAAHSVALRPVYGIPLASARRYAAVVTRSVTGLEGTTFERDADFESVMAGTAATDVFEPLAAGLEAAGIAPDTVLAATVFTTQDAISDTIAIRDWMMDEYPAPVVRTETLQLNAVSPRFDDIEGEYGPVPIFQDGTLPYVNEGGAIDLTDGVPTVHGEYDARFALAIPTTDMPEAGYPIVLYAHGTGGDYRTPLGNDAARELARRGIAVMGVDQIHHGARNPGTSDPSILFFNIPNPDAARDNNRQSALDVVQQARLVANLTIPTEIVNRDGEAVRFDPAQTYFMGHSQGGLNGPLFLAIDDSARGAVLSAASGIITPALVEKVEPLSIPDLVRLLLNLPGSSDEALELEGFTYSHPVATLLQSWVEASDTVNYAHLIVRSPREGFAPKSILMTEGLMDEYSPPISIEALAAAMDLPTIEPMSRQLVAHRVLGVAPITGPVTGNLADGAATGGLLQFPDDGHFAIFRNETAETQVYDFLGSLVDNSPGTIPAP